MFIIYYITDETLSKISDNPKFHVDITFHVDISFSHKSW